MFGRAGGTAWFAFRRLHNRLFVFEVHQGCKMGKALRVNDYGPHQRDSRVSLDFGEGSRPQHCQQLLLAGQSKNDVAANTSYGFLRRASATDDKK